MSRVIILIATLLFILLLAGLTTLDIVKHGFTLLSVPSLFILVLIGVGVIGALTHPPNE